MTYKTTHIALLLGVLTALFGVAGAQPFEVYLQESGYSTGTITLPEDYAGAMAAHPTDPNIIFAAGGGFGQHHIYKIDISDLGSPVITSVLSQDIDTIGGMAVLDDAHIVVNNSADRTVTPAFTGNPSGVPIETILLLEDGNMDGDFDDSGEIVELISPILESNSDPNFGLFTGAEALAVPAGGPGNLPVGAVALQTNDGATSSELLIIDNPTNSGTAVYIPAGDAWLPNAWGFSGGLEFYGDYCIAAGSGEGVFALRDLDASNQIDTAGEQKMLVAETSSSFLSLFDVEVDAEGDLFMTVNNFVAGEVQRVAAPASFAAVSTQARQPFAVTTSPFLTTVVFNSKTASFNPPSTGNDAIMFLAGNGPGFSNTPDIVWITPTPEPASAVEDWMVY